MFLYYARALALSMLALSASCSLHSAEPQRGSSQRGYTQTRQAPREKLLGRVLAVATDPSNRQPSILLVNTKGQDWTTFSAPTPDQESVERALAEQTNGKYNLDLSKAAKITVSEGALKGTTFYIAPLAFTAAGSLKTKDSEFIWVPLYEFVTHMARISKPNAFAGRKVYIEANLDTVLKSNNNALKSASGQQLPPKRTEERKYAPEKQQQLLQTQRRQQPYVETQGQTSTYSPVIPYRGTSQEQTTPYGGVTPYMYSPQTQTSQRPYSTPPIRTQPSSFWAPSPEFVERMEAMQIGSQQPAGVTAPQGGTTLYPVSTPAQTNPFEAQSPGTNPFASVAEAPKPEVIGQGTSTLAPVSSTGGFTHPVFPETSSFSPQPSFDPYAPSWQTTGGFTPPAQSLSQPAQSLGNPFMTNPDEQTGQQGFTYAPDITLPGPTDPRTTAGSQTP